MAIFSHPLFQREQPELRKGITRQQRIRSSFSTITTSTDQDTPILSPLSFDTSVESSLTQSLSYTRLTDLSESYSMNTFCGDSTVASEMEGVDVFDDLWDDMAFYCELRQQTE